MHNTSISVSGRAQHGAACSEGAGLRCILAIPGAQLHVGSMYLCGPVHREQRADPQRCCVGADPHAACACMGLHVQHACCTEPHHRSGGRRAVPRSDCTDLYRRVLHADSRLHPLLQRCAMGALCMVLCRLLYISHFIVAEPSEVDAWGMSWPRQPVEHESALVSVIHLSHES